MTKTRTAYETGEVLRNSLREAIERGTPAEIADHVRKARAAVVARYKGEWPLSERKRLTAWAWDEILKFITETIVEVRRA